MKWCKDLSGGYIFIFNRSFESPALLWSPVALTPPKENAMSDRSSSTQQGHFEHHEPFFDLTTSVTKDEFQVFIRGELDIAMSGIVFDACMQGGRLPVVVDFTKITFMDSSGLSGLRRARIVLENHGNSLTLRHAKGQPAWLLGLLTKVNEPAA